MNRLPASVLWQRIARRLGPFGFAGIALLLCGLALVAWAQAMKRQAVDLESLAQAARVRARAPVGLEAAPPSWRAFAAALPQSDQTIEDLREVFAAAQRNKVSLPKGDYQMVGDPGSPLITYTATFVVRERYGAIKDFTADVLRSLPNAALSDLRFERPDAGAPALDVRVRFTLVYRAV